MSKKLDIKTMDVDQLRKLISCEVCRELCSRGVSLPCCQVQACRRCATNKVLSTNKCWSCNETTSTQQFVNDMDLRTAVDEIKNNNSCSLKTKLRLMGRANACRLSHEPYERPRSDKKENSEIVKTISSSNEYSIRDSSNIKEATRHSYTSPNIGTTKGNDRDNIKRSGPRPIAIDGCNVAFAHGKNDILSVKGIILVVEYFMKRGHETVVAFLPEDRFDDVYDPVDCFNLNQLKSEGKLVCPPSNTYDDRMILDFATNNEGVVVSRDKFRDIYQDSPNYRKIIEKQILVPTFIGDEVYFPEDPQGRGGLSLDQLLSF